MQKNHEDSCLRMKLDFFMACYCISAAAAADKDLAKNCWNEFYFYDVRSDSKNVVIVIQIDSVEPWTSSSLVMVPASGRAGTMK